MELTWERVISILIFCGAVIKWGVPQIKILAEHIEARRKAKRERELADRTGTADLIRAENESDGAHWDRLNDENERLVNEVKDLKAELKELRESPSLSFATRTKWYQKYRYLGVKIDKHETNVVREMPHNDLLCSVVEIKKSYDELGETMP